MLRVALILIGAGLFAGGQIFSEHAKRTTVGEKLSPGTTVEASISCHADGIYSVELERQPLRRDGDITRLLEDRCKNQAPLFVIDILPEGGNVTRISGQCHPRLALLPPQFELIALPCRSGEHIRVSTQIIEYDDLLVRTNYKLTAGPTKLSAMSTAALADTARIAGSVMLLIGGGLWLLGLSREAPQDSKC